MINIIIADDQMLTREGLKTILDLEEDFTVVGSANNGAEACDLADLLLPDVVLLDIRMPLMDGLRALKRIRQQHPEMIILILTTFIDIDYIVEGMANGANGYMIKDMEAEKMIASIRDAVAGQFIMPGTVAAQIAQRLSKLPMEGLTGAVNVGMLRDEVKLTDRERELAALMLQGMNNRLIAETMQVTEGTARNYISNLYGKLEVTDRAQAIIRLQSMM